MTDERVDLDALAEALEAYDERDCNNYYGRLVYLQKELMREAPAIVAELRRLRKVVEAVMDAYSHDQVCEEEGEGECCYQAHRTVALLVGVARSVTDSEERLVRVALDGETT